MNPTVLRSREGLTRWFVLCLLMVSLTVISLPGYALTVETVAGAEEVRSQSIEVEVQRYGMAVERSIKTLAGPKSGKTGETFQFELPSEAYDQRLHLKIRVPEGTFYRQLSAEELKNERYRLTVPPFRKQVDVNVREHDVVIQPHRGQLIVREILVLDNPSESLTGGDDSLWVDLPDGSYQVTPGMGVSGRDELDTHPKGLSYTPLIPPGETQIGFFYLIPFQGNRYQLTKEVPVPTRRLAFAVPTTKGLTVRSKRLKELNRDNNRNRLFVRSNMAGGEKVKFSLEGIGKVNMTRGEGPAAPTGQPEGAEGPQRKQSPAWSNVNNLILLAVLVILLLFAGGYIYVLYRPDPDSSAESDRSFFIEEIARLDQLYEDDRIPEEYYENTRRRWKEAARQGQVTDDEQSGL